MGRVNDAAPDERAMQAARAICPIENGEPLATAAIIHAAYRPLQEELATFKSRLAAADTYFPDAALRVVNAEEERDALREELDRAYEALDAGCSALKNVQGEYGREFNCELAEIVKYAMIEAEAVLKNRSR